MARATKSEQNLKTDIEYLNEEREKAIVYLSKVFREPRKEDIEITCNEIIELTLQLHKSEIELLEFYRVRKNKRIEKLNNWFSELMKYAELRQPLNK